MTMMTLVSNSFPFPLVISSTEKESESCVIIVISVISARATAHVYYLPWAAPRQSTSG